MDFLDPIPAGTPLPPPTPLKSIMFLPSFTLYTSIGIYRETPGPNNIEGVKVERGMCPSLRPDFTSNLVHVLAFGTPKFYIAPYGKINHGLVNPSYNNDVKPVLNVFCAFRHVGQTY